MERVFGNAAAVLFPRLPIWNSVMANLGSAWKDVRLGVIRIAETRLRIECYMLHSCKARYNTA